MACIPGDHVPALNMVITDGHGADIVVMAVAGVERQPDRHCAVDTSRGALDAHRHLDLCPGVVERAPRADTVDAGNAERPDMAGRRGRGQGTGSEYGGTNSDNR